VLRVVMVEVVVQEGLEGKAKRRHDWHRLALMICMKEIPNNGK